MTGSRMPNLFGSVSRQLKIVNVASVPQRSPFRYAGGKTWLVPRIREWLSVFGGLDKELIETFAGGGIVTLTAVMENLVGRATMIELDEDVAAVWETILGGEAEWLAGEIERFNLTQENVNSILSESPQSVRERALATIVKNRVTRGGILAPGVGFVKHGENGKGLASRWYPKTLKKRILAIDQVRHRIKFIQGDAIPFLKKHAKREDLVFFIDPPYTKAGRRLYKYSDIDHDLLFKLASNLSGNFLMTYDNEEEIRALAQEYGFQARTVPMRNTHLTEKLELLIGKDLDWLS
ncbi:MAG: DNA adenine methylase [candidate division WOR-3 bacterium]|nr:DNA adenine methylase [candidate division WOR-3 bacterium]